MISISIVTAYYNRKTLFVRTLKSIQSQNFNGDYEVIAVDDGSDEKERLEDLVIEFPFLKVIRLEKENKWYKNSCIPFNIGFKAAKGDKIIIQNPECYHFSSILQYVEDQLIENTYLSFGCYSLGKKETDNLEEIIIGDGIESIIHNNNHIIKFDGENGWYNHSVFRPESYHFCTAILRTDLLDLGGFDERFAHGVGVDDDEIVYRIKLKQMNIVFADKLLVLHQNHYSENNKLEIEKVRQKKNELYMHNRIVFEQITKKNNWWRSGYLPQQELLIEKGLDEIEDNYKKLLYRESVIISKSRIKRKLAHLFLKFLSKL